MQVNFCSSCSSALTKLRSYQTAVSQSMPVRYFHAMSITGKIALITAVALAVLSLFFLGFGLFSAAGHFVWAAMGAASVGILHHAYVAKKLTHRHETAYSVHTAANPVGKMRKQTTQALQQVTVHPATNMATTSASSITTKCHTTEKLVFCIVEGLQQRDMSCYIEPVKAYRDLSQPVTITLYLENLDTQHKANLPQLATGLSTLLNARLCEKDNTFTDQKVCDSLTYACVQLDKLNSNAGATAVLIIVQTAHKVYIASVGAGKVAYLTPKNTLHFVSEIADPNNTRFKHAFIKTGRDIPLFPRAIGCDSSPRPKITCLSSEWEHQPSEGKLHFKPNGGGLLVFGSSQFWPHMNPESVTYAYSQKRNVQTFAQELCELAHPHHPANSVVVCIQL